MSTHVRGPLTRARRALETPGRLLALCGLAGALVLSGVIWPASGTEPVLRRGPYLQSVTTTGVTIVWDTSTATTGGVRYGLSETYTQRAAIPAPATHHELTLEDLEPYTQYHYQLVDEEGQPLSEDAVFRTAAPREQIAFSFAVLGDTRSQIAPHREVIARMVEAQPDFAIHTGDMVGDGWRAGLWDVFFEIEQPLLQSVPLFTTLGNHEDNADHYFDAFVLRGNERWYAFSYGNARFICLQVDGTTAYRAGSEQRAWLEGELASEEAQGAAWRIVYFHVPPFTSIGEAWYERDLRAELVPLFERYRVALVFNGHAHNYERNRAGGVTYVVSGGGGAPLYEMQVPEPTLQAFSLIYHFVLVEVDGDRLQATVIDRDGQVHDAFDLP